VLQIVVLLGLGFLAAGTVFDLLSFGSRLELLRFGGFLGGFVRIQRRTGYRKLTLPFLVILGAAEAGVAAEEVVRSFFLALGVRGRIPSAFLPRLRTAAE
jgi:hypothetical protein